MIIEKFCEKKNKVKKEIEEKSKKFEKVGFFYEMSCVEPGMLIHNIS